MTPKPMKQQRRLYKKEFHSGVLKENCGPYAGKTVREVKDKLIQDFRKLGVADSMYDLPEQVVCRCMTQCIVKILSDQWFLNYSDQQWKAKAKESVAQMSIYPETRKAIILHSYRLAQRMGLRQNHRLRNAVAMGKRLDN